MSVKWRCTVRTTARKMCRSDKKEGNKRESESLEFSMKIGRSCCYSLCRPEIPKTCNKIATGISNRPKKPKKKQEVTKSDNFPHDKKNAKPVQARTSALRNEQREY